MENNKPANNEIQIELSEEMAQGTIRFARQYQEIWGATSSRK